MSDDKRPAMSSRALSEFIDLTTSPTLNTPLPVPTTSRPLLPRVSRTPQGENSSIPRIRGSENSENVSGPSRKRQRRDYLGVPGPSRFNGDEPDVILMDEEPGPIAGPSNPSLMKLLHRENVEPKMEGSSSTARVLSPIRIPSSSPSPNASISELTASYGVSAAAPLETTQKQSAPASTTKPVLEPLSSYTCPICFSPPTNATLTHCGHICCGACLFPAVKSGMRRADQLGNGNEPVLPRCPVCRAPIPGWDGEGGGVIGLKTRAVFTL